MKLLTKPEIKSKIQKQNEELVLKNQELRKVHKDLISKVNLARTNFSKDDTAKDFDKFCNEINKKKSKLLEEYQVIEGELNKKKEILYGIIEKQDELVERENILKEREEKLDLREKFIKGIEEKIYGMSR